MANRITYKRLKGWLETDSLFTIAPFKLEAYSGYYHIKAENGNMLVCAKTPGEVWEQWNVFKAGYFLGKYNKILRG